MKKGWTSPELVVLVRHLPEEAVLQFCKFDAVQFLAPNDVFANCNEVPPSEQVCAECQELVAT
jgi:hypothetical protein